mmetsp:Transcript_86605/g.197659  ORF Transcript_86605/g.197659 Transcript_86605/m.197659 type:complete len:137 (-) Transcript_86605:101-511(-)
MSSAMLAVFMRENSSFIFPSEEGTEPRVPWFCPDGNTELGAMETRLADSWSSEGTSLDSLMLGTGRSPLLVESKLVESGARNGAFFGLPVVGCCCGMVARGMDANEERLFGNALLLISLSLAEIGAGVQESWFGDS